MSKDNVTKNDLRVENLTEKYCDYVSELFNEQERSVSDEEIEEFQSQIRDLVKQHGDNVRLVIKIKLRKGYMIKNLGENYYRKARFIEDVVKNGIEIPSDTTYFDLTVCPAILAKNVQKNKTEVKVLNQDLLKTTIFMGETTADREKVFTGKGETYTMPNNTNVFAWEGFDTRLVSVKEVERTL